MTKNDQTVPEGKNPALWEIAQRRASFKRHLLVYLIVNAFLWANWFFGSKGFGPGHFPWPIWTTLGWGIGLVFHFAAAYVSAFANMEENEYEKLKNK